MSCYFCKSFYHLSQNCDSYDSIESRKEFVLSQNLCFNCLSPTHSEFSQSIRDLPKLDPEEEEDKCITKCYNCFSDRHHTVYCLEKGSEMFVPKIDQTLIQRFFNFFSIDEQYAVALSFWKFPKTTELEPLIVIQNIRNFPEQQKYPNSNFLINQDGISCRENIPSEISNVLNQNSVQVKTRMISLYGISNLSVKLFLSLLTPFTKELSLNYVKFDSKIKFSQILRKICNIVKINLNETNIEIDASWAKNFVKFKKGNNFKQLLMPLNITDFNFDLEGLWKFVTTKTCDNAEIILRIPSSATGNLEELRQQLERFVACQEFPKSCKPKLKVICGDSFFDRFQPLDALFFYF